MTRSKLMLSSALGAMTAAERAKGRYMRAPDGHDGGDGGNGEGGGGSGSGSTTITLDSLPDTVDDLNVLPDKLRGLYVKDGDKFKYSDPNALRSAYERVKTERTAFKSQADKARILEDLGLDEATVKQLKEEHDQRQTEKAKAEGDFESLKKQMEDNFAKKEKDFQAREKKLLGALESSLVDADVSRALSEPGLEGNPLLLLPHLRGRVKVVETDEGFERQVLLPDGKTPMLNSESKPATLKDLLTEFRAKPEFAAAFKGNGQSGGGTSSGGGSGDATTQKRSEMSASQRVEFIRKHGQDKYLALPM